MKTDDTNSPAAMWPLPGPTSASADDKPAEPKTLVEAGTDALADVLPGFVRLTPEQRAEARERLSTQPTKGADDMTGAKEQQVRDLREQQAKAKSRGRISALLAKQAGETTKLPPTGKAALAVIDAPSPEPKKAPTMKTPSKKSATPAAKKPAARPAKKKAPAPAKKPAAKAAKASAKPARAAKPVDGVRPGSKLETIVGMLKRPEGCTTKEVLAVTGWPAVSMPQQAKSAGLKLRKEKAKGESTRYYGS